MNRKSLAGKQVPQIEIPGTKPQIATNTQHLYNIEESGDSPSGGGAIQAFAGSSLARFPDTPLRADDTDLITRGIRIWHSPTHSLGRE